MQDESVIKHLDWFGLTKYEAMIYLSLLNKRSLKASDVADLSGVPRSRVYDCLRSLELKGLCEVVSGKTKLYSAANPSRLKETLIKLRMDKIDSKKAKFDLEIEKEKQQLNNRIENMNTIVDRLSPIYEDSRGNEQDIDYIEIIKDRDQFRKKIIELCSSVKSELLAFCPAPDKVSTDMIKEQLETETEHHPQNKNAYWSSIYEIPKKIEHIEWLKDYLDAVTRLGEHVRVIDEIPVQMTVVDEETVLFQLEDPVSLQSSTTFQVIRHTRLAKSFKILYETIWQKAKDKEELDKIIKERKGKKK